MRRSTDNKLIKKHSGPTRDAIQDVREMEGVKYMEPNRDRALGESDRTGRHFDANTDEGVEASKDNEAD